MNPKLPKRPRMLRQSRQSSGRYGPKTTRSLSCSADPAVRSDRRRGATKTTTMTIGPPGEAIPRARVAVA